MWAQTPKFVEKFIYKTMTLETQKVFSFHIIVEGLWG